MQGTSLEGCGVRDGVLAAGTLAGRVDGLASSVMLLRRTVWAASCLQLGCYNWRSCYNWSSRVPGPRYSNSNFDQSIVCRATHSAALQPPFSLPSGSGFPVSPPIILPSSLSPSRQPSHQPPIKFIGLPSALPCSGDDGLQLCGPLALALLAHPVDSISALLPLASCQPLLRYPHPILFCLLCEVHTCRCALHIKSHFCGHTSAVRGTRSLPLPGCAPRPHPAPRPHHDRTRPPAHTTTARGRRGLQQVDLLGRRLPQLS